jgi:hypothetical protein
VVLGLKQKILEVPHTCETQPQGIKHGYFSPLYTAHDRGGKQFLSRELVDTMPLDKRHH